MMAKRSKAQLNCDRVSHSKSAKLAEACSASAKEDHSADFSASTVSQPCFQALATFNTTASGKARQVRIRRKGGVVVQDCDEYLGRQCNMGGWRLPKSKLFNPFSVRSCGGSALKAVEKFANHLLLSPDLIELLPSLQGKRLGCWCPPNQACHAKLIAALVNKSAAADGPGDNSQAGQIDRIKNLLRGALRSNSLVSSESKESL
eukprot:TRINITY_DN8637_c0_g2_i1.p2 TRINITY_DN8637_c0_g2~~TRINITY_DN8637_c0_g2_i1.p2  ORF type:complete len:204 (+),score=11.92 TRINITY_DN8637_c0_g2_i1:968-1579(+)